MGEWTALLYLTPDPPEADGTIFWQRGDGARENGSQSLDSYVADAQEWRDLTQWAPWYRVPSKFNRLVLFPAPYYHSRALEQNYGTGDGARLVQVTFGEYVA